MTDMVFVGRVGRPHGVAGELYVDRIALTADELRHVGTLEWRARGGDHRALTLKGVRATHDRLLVRFAGIEHREAAAELTNGELWAAPERLPDPGPGVAYTFQLVGLRVVDTSGRELGVVRDVTSRTAQPLYVVEQGGRERLYPAFEPFVKRVDLAAGVITIELPPGFEELDS